MTLPPVACPEPFAALADRLGAFAGDGLLVLQPHAPDERAPAALRLSTVLGGRLLRLQHGWLRSDGRPCAGELTLGVSEGEGLLLGAWVDSFHNGSAVMGLSGPIPDGGPLRLEGSFFAGPGLARWGWQIELGPDGDAGLLLRMFVVPPGEAPALAVELAAAPAPE